MKLGIFTDPHFSSAEISNTNRYNSKSLLKMEQALEDFQTAGCDFVICLGDLTDKEGDHEKEIANLKQIANLFDRYTMPIFAMMGNHDAFCFTVDEFYGILGEQYRPKNFSQDGKHFLFLDACYFKNGKHYMPGDSDWTDTYYPATEALKKEMEAQKGEIYLFLHQNVDAEIPKDHLLANASEIRKLSRENGRVKAIFQGHCHKGKTTRADGILYKTFLAMCEFEHTWEIAEL